MTAPPGESEGFAAFAARMLDGTMASQGGELLGEWAKLAAGLSEIAPSGKDWRFLDSTWRENPFYKRWAQGYLAMSDAMTAMIPEDLGFEGKARAELVASIVASALSPTNTLLGNPAALRKTYETGGSNLVRGFNNFLRDLRENRGMPAQVDDSGFEVGKNLAATPGKVVLRTEMFELIHFAPALPEVREIPVLLIPPQIGRYYFTDLAPGRSFAEYAVSQGLNYFAISWRNPSPDERDWGLADYLLAAREALAAVAEITGRSKVNVVGFCAGGILSALLAAWTKAKGDDLFNTLTLCVTMLDFKTEASLGAFRLPAMLKVAKAQAAVKGIVSGDDLSMVFNWMRPNDLVWNYWVNNYLMGESPPAFDILAWNKDNTNLSAQLHSDFLELFQNNPLVERGGLEIAGETIDLKSVDAEMFVLGAVTDHLTPWKACYEAIRLLGGKATFALSNGGHIAALVNPVGNPKSWVKVAPATAANAEEWESTAEKRAGSWWECWAAWVVQRGGPLVSAPKFLGSRAYPAIEDAPGRYVRDLAPD